MSEQMQKCDNCLKMFPQSKIATHFGYCRRNIKKCTECGEMYDINSQEQHQEEFHKKIKCQFCKRQFPSAQFDSHSKNCHHKPKFCEYCEQNVPPTQFSKHLQQCESRTKICEKCNQPVMNKQFLIHITTCQGPIIPEKQPSKNYEEYLRSQRNDIQRQRKPDYTRVNYEYLANYKQKIETKDYGNEKKQRSSLNSGNIKGPSYGNKKQQNYGNLQKPSYKSNKQPSYATKFSNETKDIKSAGIKPNSYKPTNVRQYQRKHPSSYNNPSVNPSRTKPTQTKVLARDNIYQKPKPGVREPIRKRQQQYKIPSYPARKQYEHKNPNPPSYSNYHQAPINNPKTALYNKKPQIPSKVSPNQFKKQKKWDPLQYGGYQDNQLPAQIYSEHDYLPRQPQIPQFDPTMNQDQELQKAILMSMQSKAKVKNTIPKQFQLDDDPMNQSFYRDLERQQLILEQAQKNKKKRKY